MKELSALQKHICEKEDKIKSLEEQLKRKNNECERCQKSKVSMTNAATQVLKHNLLLHTLTEILMFFLLNYVCF